MAGEFRFGMVSICMTEVVRKRLLRAPKACAHRDLVALVGHRAMTAAGKWPTIACIAGISGYASSRSITLQDHRQGSGERIHLGRLDAQSTAMLTAAMEAQQANASIYVK
jgi:hypothetical protein